MTIRRIFALLGIVLATWIVVLIAMPFFGSAGRQVAVVGNEVRSLTAIDMAGGKVIEIRNGAILAKSDNPGFVAALYKHGATLVLEGRIGAGCFGKKPRTKTR